MILHLFNDELKFNYLVGWLAGFFVAQGPKEEMLRQTVKVD